MFERQSKECYFLDILYNVLAFYFSSLVIFLEYNVSVVILFPD